MRSTLASLFVLTFAVSSAYADDKPSWFAQDLRDPKGFTFFCEGKATEKDGEKAALAMAEADCSRKMCMLFGVEVDYQSTSREGLKDASIDTVIKESCPKVRIVGRVTKKKSLECGDGECSAYVSQFYPVSEYDRERKRLDNPPIADGLDIKTIKDPKVCRELLTKYSKAVGVTKERRDLRIDLLGKAKTECQGVDFRNSELQNEFNGLIFANVTKRPVSFAQMANQALLTKPSLLSKIETLAELEKGGDEKSLEKAQKLIRAHFDSLFYREFPMEGAQFRLPGGHLVDTHPYVEAMKTCDAHAEVVRAWPKDFADDVTVCLKKTTGEDGEDCQTTSMIMLRAQMAGCICHLGNPERANSCTQVLLTHMNDTCPGAMSESCYRSMSKMIAEEMKIQLHSSRRKK